MIIIYTKSCLACTNKALWKRVKAFAHLKGQTIQERRVGLKQEWKETAEIIGEELPFIQYGEYAINLNKPFEEIIEW